MKSLIRIRSTMGNLKIDIQNTKQTTLDQIRSPKNDEIFTDKFFLVNKIGEGAHCVVFLAQSKFDGSEYAVKVFRTTEEEIITSIKRTFQIQQMTNDNQNFVMTYDLYLDPMMGTHYLVTEYCPWPTLLSIMDQKLKLSLQRMITANLADAVRYLHSKRICHRDIKPDNILVNPETGQIKLLDFGVAKIFHDSRTTMMSPTGDKRYRAPEQTEQYGYRESVDVWAIGVVSLQMLTGRTKNTNLNLDSLKQIDRRYVDLILKMLERDQSLRIQPHEVHQQLIRDQFYPSPERSLDQLTSNRSKSVESAASTLLLDRTSSQALQYQKEKESRQDLTPDQTHEIVDKTKINMTLKSRIRAGSDIMTPKPTKSVNQINTITERSPNSMQDFESSGFSSWVPQI